jgi:hypothetical protein
VKRKNQFFKIIKLSYLHKWWKKLVKNTLFEKFLYLLIDFLLFFWENGLEKIQDGVQFKISFQKSVERKFYFRKVGFRSVLSCGLQARLGKLKCKNFPIFKIYNLSKIGEPMVPTSGELANTDPLPFFFTRT